MTALYLCQRHSALRQYQSLLYTNISTQIQSCDIHTHSNSLIHTVNRNNIQLQHNTNNSNNILLQQQQQYRLFASKADKKASAAGSKSNQATKTTTTTTIDTPTDKYTLTFLDIFKNADELDKLHSKSKSDNEYPDWVFQINEPLPSKFILDRSVFNVMPRELQKRTMKLTRRQNIKDYNMLHAKT